MSDEIIWTKVYYFIDYWRDFLYLHSIEEELTHTIVYNPRELFKEFADEISRKEFKNKDNKKFFLNCINSFDELDIRSIDYLRSTLTLIKQQFQNPNFQYLLHLLRIIDKSLSNNKLGLNCVDELEQILTNSEELNNKIKTSIQILTKLIIFELIYKKYSIKSIKTIIDNIFDKYTINNELLSTNFPHNIEIDFHCKIESSEYQQYKEDIKNLIDNLTLNQRLLSIKNYFSKKYEKFTYIFQIKGLRGDIDITFGNVRIYNPQNVQLVKKHDIKDRLCNELFNSEKFIYYNGAVTLDVIDHEYAKQEAITLLSKTIDIVVSPYSKYKVPIEIKASDIITCDQDGNRRGTYLENNGDGMVYHDSIEISKSDNNINYLLDFYNYKISNSDSIINKKILESLHWKRRAIESLNKNEKILWYWISLENSIGDTSAIFSTVPKFLAVKQLYDFAWKHFKKIDKIINYSYTYNFRKIFEIPQELQKDIGINQQDVTIYLSNFIKNILNIQNFLNQDELLFDQLNYLKNIFDDSKKCLKLLDDFEKISCEKLIYVYRMRNKIVHDAHNQDTPSTDYYLKFIDEVSSSILFEFIRKRKDKDLETKEDILNDIIYDFDKLKIEIKEKGTDILLKHNYL